MTLSTRLLLLSMLPLALAISAEVYVVAVVLAGENAGRALSISALAVLALLWFALPRIGRAQEADRGEDRHRRNAERQS